MNCSIEISLRIEVLALIRDQYAEYLLAVVVRSKSRYVESSEDEILVEEGSCE